MDINDRVVVITGAAQGIGLALAERFAAEGAKLVLGDLSAASLTAVGERLNAQTVVADVSTEAGVLSLVERAHTVYGRVDIFVSNAGILRGTGFEPMVAGPFTPNADWDDSWRVNVMAHVWAARAVLPEMVARGEGVLVHMASAAGLLTELGSQSYSVTKHAVVGFAEWLAIHYGELGVSVVCVCPQGVRTPMVTDMVDKHEHLTAGLISPEAVAEATLNGVRAGQFMVLPHPEVARYFQNKARDYGWWLNGMRRFKESLWGA